MMWAGVRLAPKCCAELGHVLSLEADDAGGACQPLSPCVDAAYMLCDR